MFGHRYVLNREFETKTAADPEKHKDDEDFKEWLRHILSRGSCPGSQEDHITLKEGEWPDLPPHESDEASYSKPNRKYPAIYTPIRTFGNLTLIERDEIEGLHSIRNLMRGYTERQERDEPLQRPISLAVFGPPGSGKSFTVKQIASDINHSIRTASKKLVIVEYNVADSNGRTAWRGVLEGWKHKQ